MEKIFLIEEITKTFNSNGVKTEALRGVNLSVEQGESLAIMGISGSGKSTLLNIIGLLDRHDNGKYFLSGVDVSTLNDKKMANMRIEKFGYLFQDLQLLETDSVIENVELGLYLGAKYKKREYKHRVREVLESVGIANLEKKKITKLSGGEKQRVAIARALINDPDIILADEPTSALDSKTASEIMDIFNNLNKQGKTIIIVTHDQKVADKMNRIVYIVDGKMVESNTSNLQTDK